MTYQEIAAHIRRMPVQERLELLDVLARSLKDDLELPGRVTSSLERIRGIAKPDGEPPSDSDIKGDYTDYLLRKYS